MQLFLNFIAYFSRFHLFFVKCSVDQLYAWVISSLTRQVGLLFVFLGFIVVDCYRPNTVAMFLSNIDSDFPNLYS